MVQNFDFNALNKAISGNSKSSENIVRSNLLLTIDEYFDAMFDDGDGDFMLAEGITSKSAGHSHSFNISTKEVTDGEWVLTGSTVASDDTDTPHNHMIFLRYNSDDIKNGKLVIETLDAMKGDNHKHTLALVRKNDG